MFEDFRMEKAPFETMPLGCGKQATHHAPAQNHPLSLPHHPPCQPTPLLGGARVLDGACQSEIPTKLAVSVSPVSISDEERSWQSRQFDNWIIAVVFISVS